MASRIDLSDISIDVIRKDIKNIHLSVNPPDGQVRISAPERMSLDAVRVFAISKIGWIRKQQMKIREQERETPREYLERESHYVWGRRHLLTIQETDAAPVVRRRPGKLILQIRPGADEKTRQAVLDDFYRELIKHEAPAIVAKWEPVLGVQVKRLFVQHMKTKWGSCNPVARTIRLNTDLAKKPTECLEYIVVHEMTHLLEPTHNAKFVTLMDQFMPLWGQYKDQLNRLPVRHEEWEY
ncbi:M48 family metallopeptidase [Desulfomicrobium escambiense]|uniref:M48 family metallopeptidase n=1 Tax=Desulfomicrobium escambiense TaxID=29503 RepID=UPI0004158AF4|nr:SprT family zinc-dependent metalloprotease [Desulfomicrobium escambiense]